MSAKRGICHICGKDSMLTYEHVPPKAGFNRHKIKLISGEQILAREPNKRPWDMAGLKGRLRQQGSGFHVLCKTCNNNIGAWYGSSYTAFVHSIAKLLWEQKRVRPNMYVHFGMRQVQPLAIIKQMLSMFCAINAENFIGDNLRYFLLEKVSNDLDKKKYRLCMYLSNDFQSKFAGQTCVMRLNKSPVTVTEITTFPIGMVLYIDPHPLEELIGVDITDFADCKYGQEYDLELNSPLYEKNTIFPLDYRTKDEIDTCINSNLSYMEGKMNNIGFVSADTTVENIKRLSRLFPGVVLED